MDEITDSSSDSKTVVVSESVTDESKKDESKESKESNKDEKEETVEEDDTIKVGSTFTSGDLQVTVNSADLNFTDYEDNYGFNTPEENMHYISVNWTFTNIGSSGDEYVSIYDFDCYCDNTLYEQEYGLDDSDFINTNLSAGRNVTFTTYYEIPNGAQSIELEYSESVWTDDKITIVLQ